MLIAVMRPYGGLMSGKPCTLKARAFSSAGPAPGSADASEPAPPEVRTPLVAMP